MEQSEVKQLGKKGCLVAAGIVVLTIVAGALWFWNKYQEFENLYTADAAQALPQVVIEDVQRTELSKKTENFLVGISNSESSSITLSQDEINYLIQNEPTFALYKNKIFVELKSEKLYAQLSLPLNDLGLKGRYLNGMAEIKVTFDQFQPFVLLESVLVNGRELPYRFMNALKKLNLIGSLVVDQKAGHFAKKVRAIAVHENSLVIRAGKLN